MNESQSLTRIFQPFLSFVSGGIQVWSIENMGLLLAQISSWEVQYQEARELWNSTSGLWNIPKDGWRIEVH